VITRKSAPKTVANNLITEHGRDGFQRLIDMFRNNESGTKIGQLFGVSRQRVSQWKAALGKELVTFEIHPDIQDLVDQADPKGLNRTLI